MELVVNIAFKDLQVSSRIVCFITLLSVKLVAFRSINPPTLMIIPKKFSSFCRELYSYIYDNLKGLDFRIWYSYISQEEYEKLIIDLTEDVELDDFIITPRLGEYSKIPIIIRSLSFAEGTGTHPTTKLILNNLKILKQYQSSRVVILDYGSGSGILSIACKKLVPNSYVISIDCEFSYLKEAINNYNYNKVEVGCMLSNNPKMINFKKLLSNFDKAILIINVPSIVLGMVFKFFANENIFFDLIIMSGIRKIRGESEELFIKRMDEENFDNYLSNYRWQTNSLQEWILLLAQKKEI
ncbi:MAG: 50S ribosomal protein L11 methyltransferase [bacterium]